MLNVIEYFIDKYGQVGAIDRTYSQGGDDI